MSLYRDFLLNDQRVIQKWTHYFPVYERHFSRFINESIVFWEIGVSKGGSLQMWKRYLGPFVTIVGIDIDPDCKELEEDQINVRIGDQSDIVFLQSVVDEFGPPDVVLDDGSHIMKHICITWDFLYDKLNKNGVYFVEDLHTAYWDQDYDGGLKREGTFIEYCKILVDDLHESQKSFAKSTYSISFYDSIAVFENRRTLSPLKAAIDCSPIYNNHFNKFVNRSTVFWMLGIDESLEIWRKYFGPFATIIAIDTDVSSFKNQDEQQIYIRIGNSSDAGFLQNIIDEFGVPDIVLDRGNHDSETVLKTWNILYDKVDKNGVYLLEISNDGDLSSPRNLITEHCKELIDSLNAKYNELDGSFAEATFGILFYKNCIVFEKKIMSDCSVRTLRIPGPKLAERVRRKRDDFFRSLKSIVFLLLKKLGLYDIARKTYHKFIS